MYPTMFRIPFLPEQWAEVKSYGVMMMVAFLGGIWLACRRAMKVKADPDVVLNTGFISLVSGVVGARAFFVIHYWQSRFANQPNPWLSVFDIRAGGLEFWGGPLLVIPSVIIYLWMTKKSIRWYLDIAAPSLMFGMAMARIGCFLNGCCWGSVCVNEHDPAHHQKGLPWAVQYPYGSPAMVQQWEFGQLDLPKELLVRLPNGQTLPLPRDYVDVTREDLDGPDRDLRAAQEELEQSERLGLEAKRVDPLKAKVKLLEQRAAANRRKYEPLFAICKQYGLEPSELRDLAQHYASHPSHPAQLYACITGLILYWVLDTFFYWRKRHGVVLGMLLILYSMARIFEEAIRQDNPLDAIGLTWSTVVSLAMIATGIAWIFIMRQLPLKSPLAVPFEPPPDAPEARPAATPAS